MRFKTDGPFDGMPFWMKFAMFTMWMTGPATAAFVCYVIYKVCVHFSIM